MFVIVRWLKHQASDTALRLLIATAAIVCSTLLPPIGTNLNDYTLDYLSGRALLQDGDAYASGRHLAEDYLPDAARYLEPEVANPHTPIHITLLTPLALLSYPAAALAWQLILILAFWMSIWLVARELWPQRAPLAVAAAWAATPLVYASLGMGTADALTLLLLVGTWKAMRHQRWIRGGIALGVAAALRINPLFMLIPLARAAGLRTALIATTAFVGTSALGVAVLGVDRTALLVTEVQPWNFALWRGSHANVSFVGQAFRWFAPGLWRDNGPDLESVATGLAALGIVVSCVMALRTPAARSGDVFLAGIPWMVLAAPLGWIHQVLLLVPLLLVIYESSLHERNGPPIALEVAVAVLFLLPPLLPAPSDVRSEGLLTATWPVFTLSLLVIAVVDLVRRRSPGGALPDQSHSHEDQ